MSYKEKITSAGRTYNIQREIVPTQVKSVDGPELLKINLNDPAYEPTNLSKPEGTPMTILQAEGIKIDLSKRTHEAMNFWHRSGDFDEVIICVKGQIMWETEIGNATLNAGEMLLIPRGIAHRSLPGTPPEGENNLIIELKINNPVQQVAVKKG